MGKQYRNNYLKNVIFRIDLMQPLASSKKSVDAFSKLIKEVFPKKETLKQTIMQASIVAKKEGSEVKQSQQNVTNYRYTDKNSEKILMLEPSSNINLTLNIYNNSKELKEIIRLIADSVLKVYGNIGIKRTGLRYINDIILQEGDAFDWKPFIVPSLISSLDFPPDRRTISRGMGVIELTKEDYKVRFQFGMFNPEYPNPIARREFVLDYDCYTTEIINISDMNDIVETLQKEEEDLFERSILDGLREIMGVIRDE